MAMDGYAQALFVAILCILFICYCIWRRDRNEPVINWPLFGMLPGILINAPRIHDYATDSLRRCGLTFTVKGPWFTKLNFIITSDPANLHYILSTNFGNFRKGPAFKKIFEFWGNGILVAESESWKAQRKLTHSVFKDNKFRLLLEKTAQHKVEKGMFPILDHILQQGTEVDMQDLFMRFTFDVICMVLLGFNSNSLTINMPHVLIATATDVLQEALFRRHYVPQSIWTLQEWLRIGEGRKVAIARKTFDDFVYHHISLKRELIKGRTAKKEVDQMEEDNDLITRFIKEEEKEGNDALNISDDFLRDSVVNLLSAARDSTSAALSWFFSLVAANPSVEDKILEEIKAHFHLKEGDCDSPARLIWIRPLNCS